MDQFENNKMYGFTLEGLFNLENTKKWVELIATGGSLPNRFYHSQQVDGLDIAKSPPDFSNPNIGLILSVVSFGRELGIPPMSSLNKIIPFDGKMTVKGDAAKSMIFSSGLVKSWEEHTEGSFEGGDYNYIITSKRIDEITLTSSFGMIEARQADLLITQTKLDGPDGNTYRLSPWYRYFRRMCMYRALGFIARDLYPEVMGPLIVYEEARDYPDTSSKIIESIGGVIALDGREGKAQKSTQLLSSTIINAQKANEKINTPATDSKASKAKKHLDHLNDEIQRVTTTNKLVKRPDHFDDRSLLNMGAKIYDLAVTLGIAKIIESIPKQKTNKKYRDCILAWQDGKLKEHIKSLKGNARIKFLSPPPPLEPLPAEKDSSSKGGMTDADTESKDQSGSVNEEFERAATSNFYDIYIPEIPEGAVVREFSVAKDIHSKFRSKGITSDIYMEVASRVYYVQNKQISYLDKFTSLEILLTRASTVHINYLLNQINA